MRNQLNGITIKSKNGQSGIENYYVWIPRYCYKIDTQNSVPGNERMDVKFINTYNEYIDGETRK